MPQGSVIKTFQAAGYAFSNAQNARQTFEHPNVYEIALPAGKAGTLDTRSTDTTGVVGLATGHGITTGMVVDLYWSGGVRYGVATTVAGDDVTISGGAGDVLPIATTAVVMTQQILFDCNVDGDDVQIFGAFLRSTDAAAVGHLDLQDVGDASIEEFDLVEVDNNANGMLHAYDFAGGDTNVLTGNPITHGQASNGSSTAAATLYVIAGENVS